ncbi:transcobalamin-2-like [Ylistrum balloti]|uniref:transcobalamin-2-like n=1 Tax=Ylistrum balloti TaxID=509963 RepID=UPI00290590A9|nr:transcobalamin-2-like [Ylistrum balloti]
MEKQGKVKNGQMAPTEKEGEKHVVRNMAIILLIVAVAIAIAIAMIVYIAVIKECVQVSLSSTPEWSPYRIDTAEAIIGVTLGYPKAYEEYRYEYQAKLYNMNIDLLAALGNDSELSSVTWSLGKLAQYISGIVVSCQHAITVMSIQPQYNTHHNRSIQPYYNNEASMITMACTCLNTETSSYAAQAAADVVWREIMNENNTLNEYSLGLAAQALIATKNETFRHGIAKSQMGIISKLQGKIPEIMKKGAAVSQILPALANSSFLDIEIHPPLPGVPVTANWTLNITIGVEDPILTNTTRQWNSSLLVPSNATLLQAMEALQNEASSNFSFDTVPTSFGPMVITVYGITRNETNMYWRIMKAPDIPLQTGIADTYPQNNDHYIFKLTSF